MTQITRMTQMTIFRITPLALLLSLLTSCAPKIYVIDRQTVFEEEAAGQWPQFDQEILNKAKVSGPTPFPKTPVNVRKQRLYNVLNGELLSSRGHASSSTTGTKP